MVLAQVNITGKQNVVKFRVLSFLVMPKKADISNSATSVSMNQMTLAVVAFICLWVAF